MISLEQHLKTAKKQSDKDFVLQIFQTFRKANKIFNLCFQKYCPKYSQEALNGAKGIHTFRYTIYEQKIAQEKFFASVRKAIQKLENYLEDNYDFAVKNSKEFAQNFYAFCNKELIQFQEEVKNFGHDARMGIEFSSIINDRILKKIEKEDSLDLKEVKFVLKQLANESLNLSIETKELKSKALECDIKSKNFPFFLYLAMEDKNDDDILIEEIELPALEKSILKEIKKSLLIKNQTAEETFLTLQLTEKLLRKILAIMSNQAIISDLVMAHHKMAKWADLGYWFLEKLETLALMLKKMGNKSNIKKYIESTTIQEIKCHLKIVLLNVGFCLADVATDDLELFFAEKYLEQAERINVCDLPHLNVNTFSKLVSPCGRAVIAYKNNDLYTFFTYLDETTANYLRFHPTIQLTTMTLYFSVLLKLSIIAKDTLEQKLPHLAVKYHNSIKKIFECAEKDENFKRTHIVGNEAFLRQKAEFAQLAEKATQDLQTKIRDALTNTFLTFKFRIFAIQDSFAIFIPLEKLPNRKVLLHLPTRLKTLFAIDKIQDNELVGNNRITGIRIILLSFDINEIIPAISVFLSLIDQASNNNNNKLEADVALAPLHKLSFQENNNNATILAPTATQQENTTQQSYEKNKSKKCKSVKSTAISVPSPKVLETLHAHDFGFHTEDNPEVTPIYFSTQGQKAQKPTVFVNWKGIPKVEEKIENLFKEMLNPTIEGLVTVGVRNQAGAKIFMLPQALGDDWNLCGLRFKRKGNGAGWLRAIAIPGERVTVDLPDGKQQNRYLFTLGKAKNK